MTDQLLTDRLVLRRWRPEDRDAFAAINADPEVMEYFVAPLSRAESDAVVDRIEAHFADHGIGLWAVTERHTHDLLGFTGLNWTTFEAPFTPAWEIGWRLGRAACGHGYATEAAAAALADGAGRLGIGEIVSFTSVVNVRSQRVMERIGMTRDPAEDFDNPKVPAGHPLRPHVLYRIRPTG